MSSVKRDHIDEILSAWSRERPDLDTWALGLLGRLFRTVRLADDALADGLRRHDLQAGWFDLLAALRRAGAPFELNPTQLIEATLVSSGGMTKRLDRLVEQGLVERRPDPNDRRGTLVRLTRRGKTTIDQALETHTLSPAQQRSLDRLLRTLLASLENRKA
jgi:DNA-binding MarR family transcriptional regulator